MVRGETFSWLRWRSSNWAQNFIRSKFFKEDFCFFFFLLTPCVCSSVVCRPCLVVTQCLLFVTQLDQSCSLGNDTVFILFEFHKYCFKSVTPVFVQDVSLPNNKHGTQIRAFLSALPLNLFYSAHTHTHTHTHTHIYIYILFSCGAAAQRGPWPPHSWGFLITHYDASQSVRLLWTSDQLVAETSTWKHTTIATHKHPCPRWDSNPRSQRVSGRRPTP